MNKAKSSGAVIGTGLLSALAASLCCITPAIALLAGSGSVAANFSWMEPARPYLIGLSIIVLAFAWYRQLKPVKKKGLQCNCETSPKASFLQSKGFLAIITVFAVLMMSFPLYSNVFYPQHDIPVQAASQVNNNQQAKFTIQGMTCKSCEDHVNHELSKVPGVIAFNTSYSAKNSLVTFDTTKVDIQAIATAIGKTGYKVKKYELVAVTKK